MFQGCRRQTPKTLKFMSHIQPVRCLSSPFVFGERKEGQGSFKLSGQLPPREQLNTVSSNCYWCCLSRSAGLQAPVLLSMQSSLWSPYLRLTKCNTQRSLENPLLSQVCIFKKYIHLGSNNTSMQSILKIYCK